MALTLLLTMSHVNTTSKWLSIFHSTIKQLFSSKSVELSPFRARIRSFVGINNQAQLKCLFQNKTSRHCTAKSNMFVGGISSQRLTTTTWTCASVCVSIYVHTVHPQPSTPSSSSGVGIKMNVMLYSSIQCWWMSYWLTTRTRARTHTDTSRRPTTFATFLGSLSLNVAIQCVCVACEQQCLISLSAGRFESVAFHLFDDSVVFLPIQSVCALVQSVWIVEVEASLWVS